MKKNIAISLAITICLILSMGVYSKYKKVGVSKIGKSDAVGSAFERVDLHRDISKATNFVPDVEWYTTIQSGGTGLAEASVSNGGTVGSSQLLLRSTKGFGAEQLITYEGNDGQYYTTVITSMNGSTIVVEPPLEATLSSPQTIRNFYTDPDHPSENGYKAIADYAFRNLLEINQGKHVLLGDSWFDHYPKHFSDRLAERLPNATIINAGVGGNTAQNLLDRFETSVTSHKPDIVWIMVGTNDFNRNVSKETYARNIQQLIRKVNDIGARAIVFNSSVGKPIVHRPDGTKYTPSPSRELEMLSRDYYNELENMLTH